jgi:competence protein ComFC
MQHFNGSGKWRMLLSNTVKRITERIFASGQSECLVCGGGYKQHSELGLCLSCAESIPWIVDVKCERCGRYEPCGDCRRRTETYYIRNRSAVAYSETMKSWLAMFKYRGSERLRKLFGLMLLHAYRLHAQVAEEKERQAFTVISFVPLSEARQLDRGFNQSEQLAQELAGHLKLPVYPVLVRERHTEKQSYKTRRDRLEDMKNVFAVDERVCRDVRRLANGKVLRILLVDDVYTTGSTLNECARTIVKALKADVYGLSWSR